MIGRAVRSTLAIAALLAASPALAEDAAGACPPRPASATEPQPGRWYLSVAAGLAWAISHTMDGFTSYGPSARFPMPTAWALQAGVPWGPHALVGAEVGVAVASHSAGSDASMLERGLLVTNLRALVTWYPGEQQPATGSGTLARSGPMVRAGVGAGVFDSKPDREVTGALGPSWHVTGAAVSAGAGWGWRLGGARGLAAAVDWTHGFYRRSETQPDSSDLFVASLGYVFY